MDSKKIKPRWELMPFDALDEVARVLTAGAETHPEFGWRDADPKIYVNKLCRHLSAYMQGEEVDVDLAAQGHNISPLACVAANALFLLALDGVKKGGN